MSVGDFILDVESRIKGATETISQLQSMSDAVKEAKSTYSDFEKASVGIDKGLDKVGSQIASQREKLSKAMASGDMASFWKGAGALDDLVAKEGELKQKATEAKKALDQQGTTLTALADDFVHLKRAEDGAARSSERSKNTIEGFKKMGGPIGMIATRIGDLREGHESLSKSVGSSSASMLIGVGVAGTLAAAIAAIGAAAIITGGAFAIMTANAQRDLGLTLNAIAGTDEGGQMLRDTFSEVTKSTGIAGDRLLDVTRDLKKLEEAGKIAGSDIPVALQAIAMQESALGDSSGTAALIKNLEDGKTAAGEMAAEMDRKFGGIVEDKMIGIDQQVTTLKQNLADMFDGLPIQGILKFFQEIIALFDTSTEQGEAMKLLLETIFGPLDEGAAGATNTIIRFVKIGILEFTRLVIMGRSIKAQFDAIGGAGTGMGLALEVAFAMTVNTISAALEAAKLLLVALEKIAQASGNAVSQGQSQRDATVAGIKQFKEGNMKMDELRAQAIAAGKNAGAGYAAGIRSAKADVANASTDLAKTGQAALKAADDSHSPSEVYRGFGHDDGEGLALGYEDMYPAVNDAAATMALGAQSSLQKSLDGIGAVAKIEPAAQNDGGATYNITINIAATGTDDGLEQLDRRLDDVLSRRLERYGAQRRKRRS